MKKKTFSFRHLFCLMACLIAWTACGELDVFDEDLLVGKWVNGTEYWRYNADGTGCTWDTADDVTEAEAQQFTWTLVLSTLTQKHQMEISGTTIPKVYTVTELTETDLVYEDSYGTEYAFVRCR